MILDKNKRWVTFFSHTGAEIYNLSCRLNRVPDRVVVNKSPGDETISEDLMSMVDSNNIDIVYTKSTPDEQDYDRLIKDPDSVVTLHGWMRIVPATICGSFKLYNLHPGLITKYPELKGADPQTRAFNEQQKSYREVGCVIHKVSPGVDEGKVLAQVSTFNDFHSEKQLSCSLSSMALDLWEQFLT